MEFKWMAIMFSIIAFSGFTAMAVTQSNYTDCVKAYAQSNKTADEINKICR